MMHFGFWVFLNFEKKKNKKKQCVRTQHYDYF